MQNNEFKGHCLIIALWSNNTLLKPLFSFFSTSKKPLFSLLLPEIVARALNSIYH